MRNNTFLFLNRKSVATASMDKCEQKDLQCKYKVHYSKYTGACGSPELGNTDP